MSFICVICRILVVVVTYSIEKKETLNENDQLKVYGLNIKSYGY